MSINPNFPRVVYTWGAAYGASGGATYNYRQVDVSERTQGTTGTQRGRQYELDQVQSGTLSATLGNQDAALDPTNAAGPFAGNIAPFQPMGAYAQWPPTANLLNQYVASGGEGFTAGVVSNPNALGLWSDTDSAPQVVAGGYQGSNAFQMAVPAATNPGPRVIHTPTVPAKPGKAYTAQIMARNVTAGTSITVQLAYGIYGPGAGGTPVSWLYGASATLTGGGAWTKLTYSATIPANAYGLDVAVKISQTAVAAACSVQFDAWQVEEGSTATSWILPGIQYPLYNGFTERWPQTWTNDNTYAVVQPQAADAFSLLSQRTLDDPLTATLNTHNPHWLFTLGDPQGSQGAADSTGNFPPAQLANSKYGPGSFTFGNSVTSTDPSGAYTGSTGTVATLNNPNPGTAILSGATFLSLGSAGIKGPVNPNSWCRTLAFRYTGPAAIASGVYLWSAMDGKRVNGEPGGSVIYVYLNQTGIPSLTIGGPSGAGTTLSFGGAANCADGDWHFLVFGYNASTQQIVASQDGTESAYYGSIPATYAPTGLIADNVGGFVDATVGNGTILNFKGDMAFAAEMDWLSGPTEITDLYNAWKSSFSGEPTDQRYARILGFAGYAGASSIETGLTTSMGPADFGGSDALSALQAVVDTEGGEHFVDKSGTVVFRSRGHRFNATTPKYTFGENVTGGEFPYEVLALDYDATHLANMVTVTQAGTNATFNAADAAYIAKYFPRSMTRTINASDPYECQDAASYLLSRYRDPLSRVSSLTLNPAGNPALWPVCLSLELGDRVRVMRRPVGYPAIQLDVFVEQLAWSLDDQGNATLTLQCSPVDATPYALFAAWHSTTTFQNPVGTFGFVVNASADNTNPLAAQLAPGQQLTIEPGTANAETLTIDHMAVTGPGWTTTTVVFKSASTKAHAAGVVICEALPAGASDPTVWDGNTFDSVAFSY